jgi:PAS domain-containing protein/HPt (histidine-containing phosphotransfer) domain-containing protein
LATLRAKVTAGIIGGAAVVLVLAGLIVGGAARAVRNLERNQYAAMATEARVRLDRLSARDRTRLMDAAFSDALYELAARGAAPPDSFIRPTFADRFVTQYGDRFIGIYDLNATRLFVWSDQANSALERIAAANALFRILDNREPTVGLVRQGDRLYWVAGAPILPTNYTNAAQPIRGYLVAAQPFNPTTIAPSAGGGNGRLDLARFDAQKQPFTTRVSPASTDDSVRIEFVLTDVFAQQNTLATVTASRSEFIRVESRMAWVMALAALGVIGLSVAAWFGATKWLVEPTSRLAQALAPVHAGQTPTLVAPVSSATEWTTVTNAVNRLIAHGRTGQDRFERLAAAGRDGLWERDLATGEWMVNGRFRELLGYRDHEFANPFAALTARLHPDDVPAISRWLGADVPPGKTFSSEARIRHPNGDQVSIRIEGSVATDSAGGARIVGRLLDLSDQQSANHAVTAARTARERDRHSTGRFLKAIGAKLAGPERGQLEMIGDALTGSLGAVSEAFDLYPVLQSMANRVPGAQLAIVPGVPERVEGDPARLTAALEALLATSGTTGTLAVRADQPDRRQPDRVRVLVEVPGSLDPDRLTQISQVLATGETDSADPLLQDRVLHHLAAALGGDAGIEASAGSIRRWITIPLPAIAAPIASQPDPAGPGPIWESGGPEATFEIETSAASPVATVTRPSRPSQKVELVADATVTINLDEPSSQPKPPVSESFRLALEKRSALAIKTARIALADVPIRLTELAGAVKAGEIRSMSHVSETIARMAVALEAAELERTCRDLIDAVESQYLDLADDQVKSIERAWQRVEQAISVTASAEPVVPSDEPPAIDVATLEQLSASLADGSGLGSQLVALFLAEAPGRIEAIERAAGAGDWPALRASAGDLKGMCALIGAGPLGARCVAAAGAGGPAAWTEALAIRAEWERVHKTLDGLLGARTGA